MFSPVFHRTSTHLAGFVVLLLMVGAIPALVANEEIQWRETVEDTMVEAAQTGKPVMMDFYTDW